MTPTTFSTVLCGIRCQVTEHDGQVIFSWDGVSPHLRNRVAFVYLERYDRWDLIDEDQSFGGVYVKHLEAAIDLLYQDFPGGVLDRGSRPALIRTFARLRGAVVRHEETCRCRTCRSSVRLQYKRFANGKRTWFLKVKRGYEIAWK